MKTLITSVPITSLPIGILCVLGVVLYAASYTKWRARTRGLPLPPGPPRYPFIGCLPPRDGRKLWEVNRDLCDTYGEIVYTPAFGLHICVLGGPRAILELLDKRSAITSSRHSTHINDLIGQGLNFTLLPYGERWRRHRRAFWQYFTQAAVVKRWPAQQAAARMFARKLLTDPGKLREHIRYAFAAAIIKVVHGFDVQEDDDPNIARMEHVLESLDALTPGRFLVDFIPALRFIPEWIPGAGFQRTLARWRTQAAETRHVMYTRTKEGMESGETSDSVLAGIIKRLDGVEGAEEVARNVPQVALIGGADTTYSTLQSVFLALSINPEIQKRAQEELGRVVGSDRLPSHSDRPFLPYVNAIVKESLRWQNVLPVGVPHRSTEDMVYDGYFIPSGTLLIPNTWAHLHDPIVYPEPDRFIPERFLGPDGRTSNANDPNKFMFGYGRRVCPGKHYADSALFINIATVLHAFNLTPALDEHGEEVRIEPHMTDSIISFPEDCRCTVKPRSEKMANLVLGDGIALP